MSTTSDHITNLDVLFTVTGDVRFNSRALKQLEILSEEGYNVLAVGLGASEDTLQLNERVTLQILCRPEGRGPAFFRKCHLLFKAFAATKNARVYHASDLYNLPAMAHAAKQYTTKAYRPKLVYDARERYPYVASTANRPWVRFF